MPALPYSYQYSQEEVDEIRAAWRVKYPVGNRRRWTEEEAKEIGANQNDFWGYVIEDFHEKFLRTTSLKFMRVSNAKAGSDKVDFIIEGWKVDSKARANWNPRHTRDFDLPVAVFQVYDVPGRTSSIVNAYWWGAINPETLVAETFGWRPRKDYYLADQTRDTFEDLRGLPNGLAWRRNKGDEIVPGMPAKDYDNIIGADQTFPESDFFWNKPD